MSFGKSKCNKSSKHSTASQNQYDIESNDQKNRINIVKIKSTLNILLEREILVLSLFGESA